MTTFKKNYLADISAAGIGAPGDAVARPVFRATRSGIVVGGLADGERVEAFAPDGSLVGSTVVSGGRASLDLPQAPISVYIVRTSHGVTFKFINKAK